jgi:putative membrane protein (TIGR04086 family)
MMKQATERGTQVFQVLKALLASYIVTGILLFAVTFFLYKFDWDEQMVTAGIIVIYVVSTFVGGFILGKIRRARKFLWGLVIGVLYFVLLFLISFGVYRNFDGNGTNVITTLLLCAGGGMLGGMLA